MFNWISVRRDSLIIGWTESTHEKIWNGANSDDDVGGGIGGRREDDGFSFAHVVFKQWGIVRVGGSRAGASERSLFGFGNWVTT